MRALAVLFALVVGCARPDPPQITPQRVAVTAVTPAGLSLRVVLDAYNPNRVDLSASTLTARITLAGRYDVGSVTSSKELALPAGQHATLDVPLAVTWTDLPQVLALAATSPSVPYDVDGTVGVGGSMLRVDVPFHLAGTLTRAELVEMTRKSFPALPVP